MKLLATASSVIGPAHVQDNVPNQDAVLVHGINKGMCISVCDGLGSRKLSHKGSKQATKVVRSFLREIENVSNLSPLSICQQVQKQWMEIYNNEYSQYETTCLWAWSNDKGQIKAAQVGDGLLLVRRQGQFSVVTPQRDGFGNQTQTLARAKDSDWSTIECSLTSPGDGVLLMTDGISDDLIPEHLEAFFDAIFKQLKRTNKRRCKRWLTKELNEWTTPRHGDDKSIAGIFRID
ncbi:PP2C family serine/threonine-protein phosphatase [Vibrio sp. RM-69-4]|uniref:PP2C family serine/threonine-protein phosphatase n=1 Tax=Vibrio sp. RM-69-4 TaxID=2950157 RepID=UPI00215D35BB|nr:PP2C family serine/threonine-protein phosphatase [Vibrio sp. RM-69-4]MCR9423737.1 protein phosphatase 2C domain-containing protein [Vibrio sp. RM-69-4]